MTHSIVDRGPGDYDFLSFFSFHSLFATGSCDGTACIWCYHHSQWKTCSVSVPVEENR